jgi:hypothetical protein
MALPRFSDEGVTAKAAAQQPPELEIMDLGTRTYLSSEDELHSIKERFWDERLVHTRKCFPGTSEANESDVERIVETLGEAGQRNSAAVAVAEAKPMQFTFQLFERP